MDDDEPTLAAASDVVAKIREQAAALRRGSTPAAPQSSADPNDASAPWTHDVPPLIAVPSRAERPADAVVEAPSEPLMVWQPGVEGSLINGAAPPSVTRVFWPAEGTAGESDDRDRRRLPRRWPWWLPLFLMMVAIVAVSVLVAVLLSSGPVTS